MRRRIAGTSTSDMMVVLTYRLPESEETPSVRP
jgi:hypothetical protein